MLKKHAMKVDEIREQSNQKRTIAIQNMQHSLSAKNL